MAFLVAIEPDGARFDARPDETLLQAARRSGLTLPHECAWGHCGSCKVTLLAGETELMFPGAPAISPRDARMRRVLACQSMARSDLTIRLSPSTASFAPSREQRAELVAVETLGPEIRRFTFRPEGGADFLPGQYAILHLGPRLRRAYSMCNLPDGRRLQIIAKRYPGGAGSHALAALQPGASLTLEAPFGACTLKTRPGRKIFIAGGTGVSPILALVRQAARDAVDFGAPVDVIYCARRLADLAAGEELAEAAAAARGASYRPFVDENPEGAAVSVGQATDALAATEFDPATTEFYVAGPPAMVNAVKARLGQAGTPINRVHYDSFG